MKKLPCTTKPCKDCPFRKDSLKGWLGAARARKIAQADSFVCHKNTDLQCSGHMLLMGDRNSFMRFAMILGHRLNLKGRDLVFDGVSSFINHHGKH